MERPGLQSVLQSCFRSSGTLLRPGAEQSTLPTLSAFSDELHLWFYQSKPRNVLHLWQQTLSTLRYDAITLQISLKCQERGGGT